MVEGDGPADDRATAADLVVPVRDAALGPSVSKLLDTRVSSLHGSLVRAFAESGLERSTALLGAQARRSFESAFTPVVLAQFRASDVLVPASLRLAQLDVTARIANAINTSGAFAGWRQSLVSAHFAEMLAQSSVRRLEPAMDGVLRDLTRASRTGASLSQFAARASASDLLARPSGRRPAIELRRYLQGLDDQASRQAVFVGARAGSAVAGLTGTALVVTVDGDRLDEAVEEVEGELVVPWLSGPGDARSELLDRLHVIDARVPELLHGAWDDVVRAGPAATVKVATCAVEALERTLRALAPDEPVLAWFAGQPGLKEGGHVHHGSPTHALRVRYVLRGRKGDRRLVLSQTDAVVGQVPELRSRLQAGKHASSGSLSALRAHLVSVEALLMQLVLVSD